MFITRNSLFTFFVVKTSPGVKKIPFHLGVSVGLFFILSLLNTGSQASGYQSAVASAHSLATDAGIEILQKGGNAFDAAVAVTTTLAVVEPYGSGIGGGGFWLLHLAGSNRDVMIDGRERAPLAATRDMYLDSKGNVIPGASVNGPLSAGIPGVPAALEHLAKKYGKLPLSVSLKPAIHHARNGFPVGDHYIKMAKMRLPALLASKDAAKIFLNDDKVPEKGALIIQPDLANTLESISEDGAKAFYEGKLAKQMVASVKQHGGIWSIDDLSQYKIIERSPEIIVYKGMKLVTAPPPSSGGIALAEMLNMLSFYNLDDKDEVARIHLIVEVMRRAYRDRAEYLGDPDFVDIPRDYLTSPVHAKKLIKTISGKLATPSSDLKPVADLSSKGSDTTHFSIVDSEGNRVAATLSINYPFGSGFVAEGTGILLNDEMDDFSAKPGVPNVYGLVGAEANAIEPGKRMLSSMSPSFLETGERVAILGTPGGSRIITMLLLATLDFYQGASAQHMVKLERFHHQYLPDKIFYESGAFSNSIEMTLSKLGHVVEELDGTYGNMHAVIMNKESGKVEAASDPRGEGKATVID